MFSKAKIALSEPGMEDAGKYFSLRLKSDLQIEGAEYPRPSKLLVISNINGNFQIFQKLLLKTGVINKYYEWTFNDGHLVIIGNCFSKAEQYAECLWLIYALEERARRKGGYVHYILGEQEILNLNGEWRYRQPRYASNIKSSPINYVVLYDGNCELWRWLRTKNIVERIGDILFVYAGISSIVNKQSLSIAEINNLTRRYYSGAVKVLMDLDLSIIFSSEHSPISYQGYYQSKASEDQIAVTLAKFGVTSIITGWPGVGSASSLYKGKVLNVNTTYDPNNATALFIKNSKCYWVDSQRNQGKVN